MEEEDTIQKSLVEQIFDEMFSILEEQEEFGSETTEALKQIVAKGNLKRPNRVAEGLKATVRKRQ